MVMEMTMNVKKCQRVMDYWDQLWNLTNFATKLYRTSLFFANIKKLSI